MKMKIRAVHHKISDTLLQADVVGGARVVSGAEKKSI